MTRSREHARQIAMKLSMEQGASPLSIQSSSTFADFGAAFPESNNNNNNHQAGSSTTATGSTSKKSLEYYHSSNSNNLFDKDPFAATSSENHHHPQLAFETEWPVEDQSMMSTTMPNNSSMQSKYHSTTSVSLDNVRRRSATATVTRGGTLQQQQQQQQPTTSSSSAGAVARRRFRTQMRQSSRNHLSRIDDDSTFADNMSAPSTPTTPTSQNNNNNNNNSSPYRRYHSADSIGSSTTSAASSNHHKGGGKDHVVHYTPRTSGSSHIMMGATTTTTTTGGRSVGGGGGGEDSTATSSSAELTPNLFDSNTGAGAGFTFDAFGLDAAEINRELSEAMQDLAINNNNINGYSNTSVGEELLLSAFADPADDDFVQEWDDDDDDDATTSPVGSRSSTPPVFSSNNNNNPTQQDGFVDGFRVKPLQNLPIHCVKHSPASTERSSLTSETGSEALESGGAAINLFKEKAGFHHTSRGRRVIRPQATTTTAMEKATAGEKKPSRYRMSSPTRRRQYEQKQKQESQLPAMPFLDDTNHMSPRSNPDVEFFDEDDESANSTEPEEERAESDAAGPLSDVAVNSDVPEVHDQPVHRKAASKTAAAASTSGDTYRTESTVASTTTSQEEKKEDSSSSSLVVKSVGNLRSNFETATFPRRPSREHSQQAVVHKREQQQQQQHPKWPPRSQVARLQAQHGDEMLGPDKLVSPSTMMRNQQQQQQQQQYSRETPSFVSRPKSEGGAAAVRHSQVNAILNKLETSSPRSDAGAPSPSFYNMKLRRAGVPTSSLTQDKKPTVDEPDADVITSPPVSPDRQPAEHLKKLTYRQRRELELQQQKEEVEMGAKDASSNSDVATLIKRRIAANKKNAVPISSASVSPSESFADQRDKLKPVSSKDSGVVSAESFSDHRDKVTTEARSPPRQEVCQKPVSQKSDLVIDESQHKEVKKVQPSAAVARMLMLQQIQTKVPSPPLSPRSSQDALSPQSGDEQRPKAHTPKATMMMLNAFLSGRESIGSDSNLSAPKTEKKDQADSSKSAENPLGLLALKDDPKYKRFFKMLSVGLPMDAVKHAMMKEGLDPGVMDGDPNKPVGVPLRLDPTYAKYFKMLGIGLPMDAVKHAMARDGLDPAVMDGDHNLPVQSKAKRAEESHKKEEEKDSHRRARLHWKTLRKVTSNSLWAKIDKEGLMENIEIDEREFRELFQVEKNATTPTKTKSAEVTKKGATVRVIDPKRANNGGIILARLKMSHDEMADAVDRINDSLLTAEQIEHMIEFLPTKEERKALETYMLEGGQDAAEKFDGLCECEKFMVSMMTVKHAKRKIRALLFILQFESCVQDIQQDAFTVEGACDELVSSVRMRQLLGFVLEFGNRLNTAGSGRKQKAGAFTLDSLLKLNQAKAFDKKTTFLNYLVQIVQRNHELLLQFKDDLPTVFKADKIFWDQCVSDLEEVENQLENLRKISLYQARQHMAYRLRKKNKQQQHRDDDEESLSDGEFNFTLEEEVDMLRATPVGLFTLSAIKYISALRGKVEETKQKFANVLEYFGEEDKNMQPHELFNVIVQFSRDFDKAKEQVAQIQKRKLRDERKRKASNKDTQGKPPPYSPVPADRKQVNLKVSNHQPSMSSLINDIKNRSTARAESISDNNSESVQDRSPVRMATINVSRSNATAYESSADARPVSTEKPTSSTRSVSLREKARMRYLKSLGSASASFDSQPGPKPHGSSPSPVRTSSEQAFASPARSDSVELKSNVSDVSSHPESSRASFRHRRRLEQRRMRHEATRGAAAP